VIENKYVLEVPIFNPEENFQIAKDYFKTNDKIELINKAQDSECDFLSLKFNIAKTEDIKEASIILKLLLPQITKPLMLNGCGNHMHSRSLIGKCTSDNGKVIGFGPARSENQLFFVHF